MKNKGTVLFICVFIYFVRHIKFRAQNYFYMCPVWLPRSLEGTLMVRRGADHITVQCTVQSTKIWTLAVYPLMRL